MVCTGLKRRIKIEADDDAEERKKNENRRELRSEAEPNHLASHLYPWAPYTCLSYTMLLKMLGIMRRKVLPHALAA